MRVIYFLSLRGGVPIGAVADVAISGFSLFVSMLLLPPVADLFLAPHHAGPAALLANELSLLMGRMGHFPHLDLTFPAKHSASSFRDLTAGYSVFSAWAISTKYHFESSAFSKTR